MLLLAAYLVGGFSFWLHRYYSDLGSFMSQNLCLALISMGFMHYASTSCPRASNNLIGKKTMLLWILPALISITWVIVGVTHEYGLSMWMKFAFELSWGFALILTICLGLASIKKHTGSLDCAAVAKDYNNWASVALLLLHLRIIARIIVNVAIGETYNNIVLFILNILLLLVFVAPWLKFYKLQK